MTFSLQLPFAVDGDVNVVTGHALERTKVRHVLLTEPEELPWRTSFGTPLDALRHRPTDHVQREIVRLRCRDALERWLPDVDARTEAVAGVDGLLVIRVSLAKGDDVVEVTR